MGCCPWGLDPISEVAPTRTRANGTGPESQDPARKKMKFGWWETLSMSGGRWRGAGEKDGLSLNANIWREGAVSLRGERSEWPRRRRPGPWPICFHHPAQWGAMTSEPNAGHWAGLRGPIPGRSRRRAGKLESCCSHTLLCRNRASGFRRCQRIRSLVDLLRYARSPRRDLVGYPDAAVENSNPRVWTGSRHVEGSGCSPLPRESCAAVESRVRSSLPRSRVSIRRCP